MIFFSHRPFLVVALALLVSVLLPRPAHSSQLGWKPQRTWVFVVGVLKFQQKHAFGSFPPANRRDKQLVQFFRSQGVPAAQITALHDDEATHKAITSDFAALLRRASPGDELFVYYTGHGYRTGRDVHFAAYDTNEDTVPGWSSNSILPTIEKNFKGSRALLTIDCCNSGHLADRVKASRGRVVYACATSSSAREASTGNWTFTDCLLDALRGASFVDLDRGGTVSLAEFARHARAEMAIAEEQRTSFSTTAGYPSSTVLAKAKPQQKQPLGERVQARQNGVWYAGRIVATRGRQVQVSYIGYDEPAEWFDSNDTRNLRRKKESPSYSVGSTVEVNWQGDWYAAKVLKVEEGIHYIHYIDDDSSWDEWVPSKRIRLPRR